MSGHFDLTHDVVLADSDARWRRVELSAEQIERLNNLTPAAGERHDETNMVVIDR